MAGLKAVILGAGMIADIHRRSALLGGAQLVGVMASTPARSRAVAHDWNTLALESLDELLALQPDVVHVCSPNGLHQQQVTAALAAGAHVICEKPMAIDARGAEQMLVQAREAGRIATVPFVYRFHPLVRELRARAQAGDFGPWQLLHGSYLQDWMLSPLASNWRVDAKAGGPSRAFADIGSHWCDLMEFITGERITSVCAATTITVAQRPVSGAGSFAGVGSGHLQKVETEDAACVMFRTQSGVLGSVNVSQVSAGRKNRLWFEFDGQLRSAVFDQEQPETAWLGGVTSSETLHRDPSVGAADARRLSTLPAGHAQGYAHCFEHFVADTYRAIAGEEVDGLPTFVDGLRSAHIVSAVVESARSGAWVEVADTFQETYV
ncbi:Gfo/Idh/MocA family protein [Pseudomonas sp. NPDC090592]|uniref:Gfo/Idh/MocA family protein n=1 Tax=Pseudomonas sp. NPDC090592 TaxID=3364480 RepID=UPI00383A622D